MVSQRPGDHCRRPAQRSRNVEFDRISSLDARHSMATVSPGRSFGRRASDPGIDRTRRRRGTTKARDVSIVFLTPVATLGGAERSLLDILAQLRERCPTLPLRIVSGSEGPLRDEAEKLGVDFETVEIPAQISRLGDSGLRGAVTRSAWHKVRWCLQAAMAGCYFPAYWFRLRAAIRKARPSLIHSNGLKCHFLAGYVAPRGVPVVWHIRDFISTRRLAPLGLRLFTRRPDAAVANSQATCEDFHRILPPVRAVTIYNGIDTTFFSPGATDTGELDRLAGLPQAPPNCVRVGLVATYARWKGQGAFIDAAAKILAAHREPIRFYIIGGPTYQTAGSQYSVDELRDRINGHGISNSVGLIPFQIDLRAIYRGLDIVVHASTQPEPFGRTIVEAMACGRAVVVALAGGAAEIATDEHDAIGLRKGDVDTLSSAVVRLARDPALRQFLAQNAIHTARSRFDHREMVGKILELYQSLGVKLS
ncbi:MAG: glycosyl transferase family 1 [Pirellula sp.]|nr:glycosyl transferase family 1 [Pirellula sp.]